MYSGEIIVRSVTNGLDSHADSLIFNPLSWFVFGGEGAFQLSSRGVDLHFREFPTHLLHCIYFATPAWSPRCDQSGVTSQAVPGLS